MASSVRGSLSNPLTLESATGGREALLAFVDVTKAGTSQGNTQVKCKLCDKSFAGFPERITAHFVLPAKVLPAK